MKFDTGIAGAGSERLSAMRELRRYAEDFLLITDCQWSTTGAAVGCMPSEALIEAANAFGSGPSASSSSGPSASDKCSLK